MSKDHGVSSKTHTQQQWNNYATRTIQTTLLTRRAATITPINVIPITPHIAEAETRANKIKTLTYLSSEF